MHHIEVEAEGNHRRMALQLRASTCGDALCSIEVDFGLAKPEREREKERERAGPLSKERETEREMWSGCAWGHMDFDRFRFHGEKACAPRARRV